MADVRAFPDQRPEAARDPSPAEDRGKTVTTPSTEPPAPSTAAARPGPSSAEPVVDRYGRRRPPGRRLVYSLVVVVSVLVLGFIFWATVLDRDKVTYTANSFEVRSASETVVTFDVQFHRGAQRAICTVHALNTLNTEVGLRDVEVDGEGSTRVRMTVTIPTSEEATTGLVTGCVAE